MDETTSADEIIQACLEGQPFAWEALVDWFLPAVAQSIEQLNRRLGLGLSGTTMEAIPLEVFRRLRDNDLDLLRRFPSEASLRVCLTVLSYRALSQAAAS